MRQLWLQISCVIHCWRHGHQWETSRPTRCVRVGMCVWCGKYQGAIVAEGAECRWYRR